MPELTSFTKDPDAVLDYVWDWTAWLAGDTIATKTVTVTAAVGDLTPLAVDSSTITGSTVVAWLSGGKVNTTYSVTCRVTTAGGRTEDRTSRFIVTER